MRRVLTVLVSTFLMGSSAHAKNVHDPPEMVVVILAPNTAKPTDRSITVFYRSGFDLDVETPFLYLPREVVPVETAAQVAGRHYIPGVTVVENCPIIPLASGTYRHPMTLAERMRSACIRLGYTPEPIVKRVVQKKRRR